MSFLRDAKTMGTLHARLFTFTPRLAWMGVLAVLFAGGIALAFIFEAPELEERAELFTTYLLAGPLGFLAPFFALVVSPSLASDDLEGGMGQYLFVRPVSRMALLAGRAITAALTIYILLAIGTLAVAAMAGFGTVAWPLATAMLVTLLAVPFYLGLFTLLSMMVKSSVAVGFGFIALVDLIVAALPFRLHLLAPRYHLLALWSQWTREMTGAWPHGGLNWAQQIDDIPVLVTLGMVLAATVLVWVVAGKKLGDAET